jgi:Helix-turn-helix domain
VSKKQTQSARILELLSSKSEVSALELSSVSLQYAARVCELRKTGASIANRVEVKADGTRHGFYRLVRRATFHPNQYQNGSKTLPNLIEAERASDSLFPPAYQYPD